MMGLNSNMKNAAVASRSVLPSVNGTGISETIAPASSPAFQLNDRPAPAAADVPAEAAILPAPDNVPQFVATGAAPDIHVLSGVNAFVPQNCWANAPVPSALVPCSKSDDAPPDNAVSVVRMLSLTLDRYVVPALGFVRGHESPGFPCGPSFAGPGAGSGSSPGSPSEGASSIGRSGIGGIGGGSP